MIIFKIKGGLGNQLFQYSAAYQYSKIRMLPIHLELSFFNEIDFKGLFRLDKFSLKCFQITDAPVIANNSSLLSNISDKLYYHFKFWKKPGKKVICADMLANPLEKIYSLPNKSTFLIDGWLQNTTYFSEVRNDLSNQFWLRKDYQPQSKLPVELMTNKSVAVHVRRGDMENNPAFVTLGRDYYVKAFEIAKLKLKDPQFFIFSDDIIKAKLILDGLDHNGNCTYVSSINESATLYGADDDYLDFQLMRKCKHYIIANSTFSWWPAYLSNQAQSFVIAPGVWFTNPILQEKFNRANLINSHWIVI